MSGWLVENNTFEDCQTAMLLGGGRDATIVQNHIENCALGLEFEYVQLLLSLSRIPSF
eukprot:SAG31_NODE_4355_length_3319_cov_1.559938_1_plen_58_part_00